MFGGSRQDPEESGGDLEEDPPCLGAGFKTPGNKQRLKAGAPMRRAALSLPEGVPWKRRFVHCWVFSPPPLQRDQVTAGSLVLGYNRTAHSQASCCPPAPQNGKFLRKLREKMMLNSIFRWQFCIQPYLSTLNPFVTTIAGKLFSPAPPELRERDEK